MKEAYLMQAQNLLFGYHQPLNSGLCLDLSPGKLISVVGPNGSGKSTLLKTLAGLISPYSGQLFLKEKLLETWPLRERAKHIAIQWPSCPVPPLMTVFELVSLGRTPYANLWDNRTKNDEEIITKVLKQTEIEIFKNREVASLSDGERSRVFLARSLAQCPDILLLDEPTAFLDIPHIVRLFQFLKEIVKNEKKSVIITTHHLQFAIKFSDLMLCLDGLGNEYFGTAAELKEKSCFSWAEI